MKFRRKTLHLDTAFEYGKKRMRDKHFIYKARIKCINKILDI